MPAPRLLVIEGNSQQALAEHVAAGGVPASEGYVELLRELQPDAAVDVCYPADLGAALPKGESLEGYDGITITGSSLHIYTAAPAVLRQIDLVRTALSTKTPLFGSCWGLQVITTAAGGSVRKNPKGREIGFGRGIRLTDAGRKHPMYVGKVELFDALTAHLDEIEALAPGTTVLSTNAVSNVQSAEIYNDGCVAWGVQYHPEYPLREIAAIVRRLGTQLIDEGFFATAAEVTSLTEDLDMLDRRPDCKRLSWRHGVSANVLDKKDRTSEVANWLKFQVLPTRMKRERG